MMTKITGEAPFQVLTSNYSISPSQEGYTLQISADGRQYSNLFTVGAGVTRLVTGVAAGSYYRLSGNESEVSINWLKTCVTDGGSGGAGNELTPVTEFPLGAEAGTVVALASGDTYGIYQYDGTNWNYVGGEVDLSAYWTSAETQSAITAVEDHLFDVEEVTASALTELHDDVLVLSARTVDLSAYYTSAQTEDAISAATSGKADAVVNTTNNGRTVFPKWNNQGVITGEISQVYTHSYFYLNGARKEPIFGRQQDVSGQMMIYAPTTSGNPGEILVSTGSGAPIWSAVTMPDMSEYTPTSGFSTINGSAITNGGNIVIEGGSAADPTTLKSVSELNPDAENGDVQSLYNETSGLPADVSFVTGNTYGSGGNRFGGTLTIQQSFGTDVNEDPDSSDEPVYLFSFDQDGYTYVVTATGDTYDARELVITCDNYDVLTLRSYDAPGRYNFGHNGGGTNTMSADYSIGDNDEMIVDFYRYGGTPTATDPTFDVPEASTEYGLYIKTGNGWEDISTPEDVVTSSYISNIWKGTQAEYDNIVTKDPDTFYIIVSN